MQLGWKTFPPGDGRKEGEKRKKKIRDGEWVGGKSGDGVDQNEIFLAGEKKMMMGETGQGQTMKVWKSDFLSPQTKVILYPKNKQKSLWALVGIRGVLERKFFQNSQQE